MTCENLNYFANSLRAEPLAIEAKPVRKPKKPKRETKEETFNKSKRPPRARR